MAKWAALHTNAVIVGDTERSLVLARGERDEGLELQTGRGGTAEDTRGTVTVLKRDLLWRRDVTDAERALEKKTTRYLEALAKKRQEQGKTGLGGKEQDAAAARAGGRGSLGEGGGRRVLMLTARIGGLD